MIKQFRNLNPLNILFLLVLAVILRLGVLISSPERLSFEFAEPMSRLLLPVVGEYSVSPEGNILIAMLIVVVQAILFNRLVNHYNLLAKPTFLPALIYVTGCSLLSPFLVLSPALLCNFLVLWMMSKLFRMYRGEDVRSLMFDVGMIIALGTLVYFPFIALMPILWISLIIFRAFDWREWITGLLGFATLFFLLAVYYFWNDQLSQFYGIWLPLTSKFPTNLRFNIYDYLVLVPVIAILILGFFQLRANFFRSFVQTRKSFQILFFLFVLAMISFYLKADFRIYHFILAVPPAAVLMAYYFLYASRRWLYESLYLVLAGSILYFQFV